VFAGFGFAGFVSLSLEVLWTRLLVFRLYTTVYAFAVMLTTFLAGIALGSLVYAAIERRGMVRRHVRAFGLVESAIGVLGLASIPLFASFEPITATWNVTSWREETAQKLLLSALIMIVPTLLMGAAVPLVSRIHERNQGAIGASVGRVYAVNTLGTILGALVAGFVLAPLLGTQASIVLVSTIALAVGTAILSLRPSVSSREESRSWPLVAASWTAALLLFVLTPSDTLFRYYNVTAQRVDSRAEILDAHEGIETITTVHRSRCARPRSSRPTCRCCSIPGRGPSCRSASEAARRATSSRPTTRSSASTSSRSASRSCGRRPGTSATSTRAWWTTRSSAPS
jgi:predicted membrane-bound spermidine synthase